MQISWECAPAYLSTGISNLLQPAQAEVVLGQRSTYLASWVSTELCGRDQCCQVPKFFSGQYMKKVRPNQEKDRPIYTYLHIKRKTAFSRRVNKIVNKFFSLSLSVCHNSKRRKFFQKISSAPFLPLLTKFCQNSAINSSGQIFFSPAPFELFGRNFGHLATLGETGPPPSGKPRQLT